MAIEWRRVATGVLVGGLALSGVGCPPTPAEEAADRAAEECVNHADCDDGVACNGEEYCSIDENDESRMICYDRETTCGPGTQCIPSTDTCEPLEEE